MEDTDVTDEERQLNEGEEGPKFQLLIECDRKGSITLSGTVSPLYLAYGILEAAKDALRRGHEAANMQRRRVQPADLTMMPQTGKRTS